MCFWLSWLYFWTLRWDLRVFQKYLRCCWWTTELLHTSSKNGLEIFSLSVFTCKSWWEWGWCVRFLVDQFTAFSACLWRFWCVYMLRCVIFFIGCEAYLHGILRAANVPHFDTRFYAPLFLFCVVWFNGSPSYIVAREQKIAALDQPGSPSYPVSNLW